MNPELNPFNPSAGGPPPALVGRQALLNRVTIALARLKNRLGAKNLLLTGLRGVGKTALLNRFVDAALQAEDSAVYIEADDKSDFIELLVGQLQSILISLNASAKVEVSVKRALRVLKSFTVRAGFEGLSFSVGIDPEKGTADTGNLRLDLTALFIAIGEAARDMETVVLLAIDEIQYLTETQLSALIMALHRTTQLGLPVFVAGAGLPQVPALTGNAKSYAERLFDFPIVDALGKDDARKAIEEPAAIRDVRFAEKALQELYRLTEGYPFFIQEWAYHVWNHAARSPITVKDVTGVEPEVLQNLDESFFRVRYNRLTPKEQNYLRAMAELGPGPHRSGDIAAMLGVKSSNVGPLREAITKKGMVYSPQYGEVAFTVPLFDAFMRRTMPQFKKHATQ